jgi:hypothetical protein
MPYPSTRIKFGALPGTKSTGWAPIADPTGLCRGRSAGDADGGESVVDAGERSRLRASRRRSQSTVVKAAIRHVSAKRLRIRSPGWARAPQRCWTVTGACFRSCRRSRRCCWALPTNLDADATGYPSNGPSCEQSRVLRRLHQPGPDHNGPRPRLPQPRRRQHTEGGRSGCQRRLGAGVRARL